MIKSMIDIAWAVAAAVAVMWCGRQEKKDFWDEFDDRQWYY